jgi:hypothetical protein
MLTYRRFDSLEIKRYSDANYAGDKDDRKFTRQDMCSLSQEGLFHGEAANRR